MLPLTNVQRMFYAFITIYSLLSVKNGNVYAKQSQMKAHLSQIAWL